MLHFQPNNIIILFITWLPLIIIAHGPGPGMQLYALRRRSSNETGVMQSRAVDTSVEFKIAEGKPKDTFVGYIPTKPGFKYRFNEQRKEFSINAETGEIRTLVELDRETIDHFDLVVLSSQPTYPIEVRIIVTDINDNSPEFPEPLINITITEGTPVQRILLDVATDKDIGSNSVSDDYKIIDGNEEKKFQLAVTTNPGGDITYLHLETTNSLDRETCGFYILNISARDNGIPQRYGYLQVNITVLDVNDNPPIFDHSDYIVTLNDSIAPNTKILEVHASDIDMGINAKINYYLTTLEYQFSIDPDTGVIYTTDMLSCPRREECNDFSSIGGKSGCYRSCVFTVFAQDFGSPRQNGRTYVTVNLLDSNDHDPIVKFQFFPSTSKVATVDENAINGTVVAAISVIDMDEGSNGKPSLNIVSGNNLRHFRLEWASSFYLLRVNSALDREEISQYNLTMTAIDSGNPPRSTTVFLIIEVNDENDYEPVFEKSEYQINLSESAPINTYIVVTVAKDEDTGLNAQISYDFASGNERQWFKISSRNGLITTNSKLDREIQDTVLLNVSAHDGGPNPKYAYTLVKIVLLDENDEHPRFSNDEITIRMLENNEPNTVITTLNAVDLDQGTNGSVIYSLHPVDSYKFSEIFTIDSISGQLVVKTRLDREIRTNYTLHIIAQDQGVPSLSSQAIVHLIVTDMNDNFPIIYPNEIYIILDEYTAVGTPITQIKAFDNDEGSNSLVTYNFKDKKSDFLDLDNNTGIVVLKKSLKNYPGQSFISIINAFDKDNQYGTKPATIQILKKSMVKFVKFSQEVYSFEIPEDHSKRSPNIGRSVGSVKIEQKGLQNFIFDSLDFFIIDGDPSEMFNIGRKSGVISTRKAIDRELFQNFSLTVVSYSGMVFGNTTVLINVLDLNDESPTFINSWDEILLDEDTPVGKDIYKAEIVDMDKLPKQNIYALTENPHSLFHISNNGVIYLNKTIQLEPSTVIFIEIRVQDALDNELSSKMTLKITINDVNNHSPVFDFTSYETSLSESTPVNTRFFLLKASDVDLDENGRIVYEISEGNENDHFGVFPDGYLYVKNQLDREEQNYYSLYVSIRDHGFPIRKSTVPIVIHVKDENDNPPSFINKTFSYTISANEPKNSFIGTLQATDKDVGRNAELFYAIVTNQKNFEVDARTGIIKTLKPLENPGEDIKFEVSVTDNGRDIRYTDKAHVKVTVKYTANRPPAFSRKFYTINVPEDTKIGSVIYPLKATSANSYKIISGNELRYFEIQQELGQIILIKMLDRESQDYFELLVMAESNLNTLNDTSILRIIVQDVNDNHPEIKTNTLYSSIKENVSIGTTIATFTCTDNDLNDMLNFAITAGNKRDLFKIKPDTGLLYLHKSLDYEDTQVHQLNITCFDGGNPILSTNYVFKIFVIDVNDNPPYFPNTAVIRQIKEGIPVNSKILTLTAEDLDSRNNGKIKYSILNESPKIDSYPFFAINETSGVIRTLREIDREIIDNFKLIIRATDQADQEELRLSSDKLVTVIVEDVNDNAPEFISMNTFVLPLDEASFDMTFLKISATDKDASTNGQITYSLVQSQNTDTDLFHINRNTGVISIKKLKNIKDFQLKQKLLVRATDEAAQNERKSTDSYITILFTEIDNGPVFDKFNYVGNVFENEPPGTSILKISAKHDKSNKIEYYVTNVTNNNNHISDRLFEIDPQTGVLSMATELDREKDSEIYFVYITAIAILPKSIKSSSLKVRVNILDRNDSPPQILEPLKFSVLENKEVGYIIGQINASDADLIGNLEYTSEDSAYFKIDSKSGNIKLINLLDREQKSIHSINVQVTDEIQFTNATIHIEVIDVNDNAPELDKSYSFDIPENATYGFTVGKIDAYDKDLGRNSQIKYKIISNWATDIFGLDTDTGVLTVTSKLDYEETQHYILIVQAEDQGDTLSLSSTTTVYCNVIDLNDNTPYFISKHHTTSIREDITIGTKIMTIEAFDEDSGSNGRITYSITDGNHDDSFRINDFGEIYVKHELDREKFQLYTLTIKIQDNPLVFSDSLFALTQVEIHLTDVNDQAPYFVTPNYTSIIENSPVNTIVMNIKALDGDEGNNALVKYNLYSETSVPFILGSNDGILRVSGPIDHEVKKIYILYISAHDHGTPSLFSVMNLTVEVLDENDNSPVFDPKHYSASIAENASIGTSVLQVSATDTDEGYNGEVRYSIISGDMNENFLISEDTGILRVAKNLNYERKTQYKIEVRAEDRSKDSYLLEGRFDTADLLINIKNINDNIPLFIDSPYVVNIMEETILPHNGYFLTVNAFDADYGSQSKLHLRYFLKEGNTDLFSVNPTGDIYLRSVLDREKQSEHILTIIAIDSDIQTFTGTGTINVLVQDINDHAPQFEKQSYFASIPENMEKGILIDKIQAFDKDIGENSIVRYSIQGEFADQFFINSSTGEILSNHIFDREEIPYYFISVVATDQSLIEPKSSQVNITIKIIDENDNAPKFYQQNYTIHLSNKLDENEFVLNAKATDIDEGQNGSIKYSLEEFDSELFYIDSNNGIIRSRTRIQEIKDYKFIVRAEDMGNEKKSSTCTVVISIKPFKNFPTFVSNETEFTFHENIMKKKEFSTVKAISPKSSDIKYTIASGSSVIVDEHTGVLSISETGLDYENLRENIIWIAATDTDLLTVNQMIRITVLDVNDNAPVAAQDIYEVEVMEEEYPPLVVAQIEASDLDNDMNGKFKFYLNDTMNDSFDISHDTGIIKTLKKLDREQIPFYQLVVDIVDMGKPALTGTALVKVHVKDKNDNPPRFTRLFNVNITENAEIGFFVTRITSIDLDSADNAKVTYSLSENPGEKFKIDSISGNVTVAGHLDRESDEEYILKVVASDGAWRSETTLSITIQDVNDCAPIFEHSYYSFNFPEFQKKLAFVGQVVANDHDKVGPNSIISYSLQTPSDIFAIDPASGEIYSKRILQYKQTKFSPENVFSIIVLAIDNGKPPMHSETLVNINIIDANNNSPKFLKKQYIQPILQFTKYGQKLIQVRAIDNKDFGINAEISYQIVGGNGSNLFNINHNDGWISTRKQITEEINQIFILQIKAQDRGIPPQSDEALVQFVISGENKFAPVFTALSYQVIVPENQPIGSTILKISATDLDEGLNGQLIYSISNRNEFSIDKFTGAVKINSPLDFEFISEYQLNITVQDLGFESYSSVAMLKVIVTDVNDNAPYFEKQVYHAYLAENSPIGSFLNIVEPFKAKDKDSAKFAEVEYSIISGNGKDFFGINRVTAQVTSKIVFDFEEKAYYNLIVSAKNPNSNLFNTTEIQIHITGENEFIPKFVKPVFYFDVPESKEIGSIIGSVKAKDYDAGDDGEIFYHLLGNRDNKFSINKNNGDLKISRPLDRETQSRIILTVMAKNVGSIRGNDTDEAQIIISIQDGNDAPEFEHSVYNFNISEDSLLHSIVGSIKASDKDIKPQNHQFNYVILEGNLNQTFAINSHSGIIVTNSNLDREIFPEFQLRIAAIDTGIPPQTGTTLVNILLTDINDCAPYLDSNNLLGFVLENEPIKTKVMTLKAVDNDLPPNGAPFSYNLVTNDFFEVDKYTGIVRTSVIFDRENQPEVNFTVEIEDNGIPKLKSRHTVTVKILDKNDNPSLPRTILLEVYLYKGNILPNTIIGNVRPIDYDTTGNYQCNFLNFETNINEFAINNDCFLSTTEHTRFQNQTLKIKGNDGMHPDALITVDLRFHNFNDQRLKNIMTIHIENITIEKYYSDYHETFNKNLEKINTSFKIFNIHNRNKSIEIIILAENTQGTDSKDVIKEQLTNNFEILFNLFERKVVIGYSPCQDMECENGGTCQTKLKVTPEHNFVSGVNYILSAPTIINEVECVCLEGYLGENCKNFINVCLPNPCQAGGKCKRQGSEYQCICPGNRKGKFCEIEKENLCSVDTCKNGGICKVTTEGNSAFCICHPGYRGSHCENVIDACRPNPCLNGGSCIPLKPGFSCTCSIGYYGSKCEKSSFGFNPLSYMLFPELDASTNDISIVFATTKPNSLLLYNYGVQIGGRSDFIALEIIAGKIVFSFGGSQTAITSLVMGNNHTSVADGQWYKVIATRNGRVMSLTVSNCTINGEKCYNCQIGDTNCYTDDIGPTSTLNFNKNSLLIGGIMTESSIIERPGQVHTDDFIGCIQTIMINGRLLNLNTSLKSDGVSPQCNRVKDLCGDTSSTCRKDKASSCADHWDRSMCTCDNHVYATDCEDSILPISLTDGAYIQFKVGKKYRRTQLLPSFYTGKHTWERKIQTKRREIKTNKMTAFQLSEFQLSPPKQLSITFKTFNPNGLLIFANTKTNKHYTIIELKDGQLIYTSFKGTKIILTSKQPTYFADGEWHTVKLTIDTKVLKMTIDSKTIYEELYISELHDILDPYLSDLFIGNVLENKIPPNLMFKSFEGCLANFTINDEIQSFNGRGGIFDSVIKHGKIFKNCFDLGKLGTAQVTDPLSIGLSLVIGFIIILLIATAVSFIFFRFHKLQKEKSNTSQVPTSTMPCKQTVNSNISSRPTNDVSNIAYSDKNDLLRRKGSHYIGQEPITKKLKDRDITVIENAPRSQRPDIIEREVGKTSSLHRDDPLSSLSLHEHNSNLELEDFGHNYDIDNNSSIAPFHYKGFREGVRKFRASPLSMPAYHKHQQQHTHSSHHAPYVPRVTSTNNPNNLPTNIRQHQTTPLARLSPSSELSSQHPRILTLHDISGKPLQSALLATTSSSGGVGKDVLHSNSERSLNSPVMSQMSAQSSSASRKNLMAHGQNPKIPTISNEAIGLTTEEIERLNARQRTSSLVSTLDAVSVVSSSEPRVNNSHIPHMHHTQNDEISSTSSDESGNDSFTCSEIEFDNNSIIGEDKYHSPSENTAKIDVTENVNKPSSTFDGTYESSFRGSISTVASDDDLSSHIGNMYRQPTAHWDYLLNWGPNFENLVGVFKDIAELPDSNTDVNNSLILPKNVQKPSEEYV